MTSFSDVPRRTIWFELTMLGTILIVSLVAAETPQPDQQLASTATESRPPALEGPAAEAPPADLEAFLVSLTDDRLLR